MCTLAIDYCFMLVPLSRHGDESAANNHVRRLPLEFGVGETASGRSHFEEPRSVPAPKTHGTDHPPGRDVKGVDTDT